MYLRLWRNIQIDLEISPFVINFATNLVTNFVMSKKITGKEDGLALVDYYRGLDRGGKSRLLLKVQNRCGISYTTARAKLCGQHKFKPLELAEVGRIIQEDESERQGAGAISRGYVNQETCGDGE